MRTTGDATCSPEDFWNTKPRPEFITTPREMTLREVSRSLGEATIQYRLRLGYLVIDLWVNKDRFRVRQSGLPRQLYHEGNNLQSALYAVDEIVVETGEEIHKALK